MEMKFSQLNLPIVLIISLYDLRIYYKEPRIKVPRSNDQSVKVSKFTYERDIYSWQIKTFLS